MKRTPQQKHAQIHALADALNALPDDAERDRLVKHLDVIVTFFDALRKRLQALPSSSEKAKTLLALEELTRFLEKAQENEILAAALGLSYERAARGTTRSVRPQASGLTEALLNELKELPTNEIQEKLNDYKTVSMDDLNALAVLMGLKFEERMKRQDLVDRIVKIGFANIRGYDLLRRAEAEK